MTSKFRLLAYYALAIFISVQSCTCSESSRNSYSYKPVRSDEFRKDDQSAPFRYRANEILVMYKGTPTQSKRDSIRDHLKKAGINPDSIKIRTCNSCNSYVELWQAENIHTYIHGEGIVAGTVSGGSRGVGEDSVAAYSLNYLQQIPTEEFPDLKKLKFSPSKITPTAGKDTIIIAVLDTGVDTVEIVRSQYLWRNEKEKSSAGSDADANCYNKDTFGWNFVTNTSNIHDDNASRHGTIITQYIIDEFQKSNKNIVQIMSLKTHDSQGRGDLFSSICALHYAADKGANIINASWGFYYYQSNPHPYLDSLITKVLSQKGILFVTASGNKIAEVDAFAKARYLEQYGVALPDSLLRDLSIHNFYPACFGDSSNNVIVATTTDGNKIAPTQNFSTRYVDFGVKADTAGTTFMKFKILNTTIPIYVSGSSFATAILSGRIGAMLDHGIYNGAVNKTNIISQLETSSADAVLTSSSLDKRRIRKGRYIKH